MEYEKVIIETSKSIYRYLLKIGVTPAEAEVILFFEYVLTLR